MSLTYVSSGDRPVSHTHSVPMVQMSKGKKKRFAQNKRYFQVLTFAGSMAISTVCRNAPQRDFVSFFRGLAGWMICFAFEAAGGAGRGAKGGRLDTNGAGVRQWGAQRMECGEGPEFTNSEILHPCWLWISG